MKEPQARGERDAQNVISIVPSERFSIVARLLLADQRPVKANPSNL
jgi:hypothetical protein